MKKERRSIISTLSRCLRLRCPACGQSSIVERLFHIRHHCPACGVLFKREEGFFVGAIMVNVVTTEFLIIAVYLSSLLIISSQHQLMITMLFIVGILFPIAFYHHSWSIWLGFDYLVESLPKYVQDRAGQTDGRK
ncbi:MAG TPA: DUF983 domain-containing protein [Pyrinomonadaceae bacterium]